jgi:hypothetical protein
LNLQTDRFNLHRVLTYELTTYQFIKIDNRAIDELTTDQFMNAGKNDTGELTTDQFTDTDTV